MTWDIIIERCTWTIYQHWKVMPIRDVTCSILGSPEPYQSHLECSRPINSTKFLIMIKKFVFQKPLQTYGKVTYLYIYV